MAHFLSTWRITVATTYTKLRNGDWGVRVEREVKKGDKVTVTKKNGGTKTETIAAVLFTTNEGVRICAIDQNQSSGSGRQVCAECGKGGQLVEDLEDGLMKHYRCCDIPPGGY